MNKAIVAAIVGVVLVAGVTIAIVSSGGGEEAGHSHALATFEDLQGNARGLVMNMNGGPMTQASLEKPENVYMGKYTCSLKWKNKIYFIGGYGGATSQDQMRQISVLDKCQLERVGNLTVDMPIPSCHTTANAIFLCFYGSESSDIDDVKRCYKGKSPLKVTERLDDTQYTHSRVGLSSSETHMIAVGSAAIWGSGRNSPDEPSHFELEVLDLSTFKWVVKSPYPSHIDYPTGAATLYLKGRFYVFGGHKLDVGNYLNRITYYDPNTDVWAHGGFLGSNGEELCNDCWYPGQNMGILPVNNDKLFVFNGQSEVCTYDGYAKYTCEDTSKDTINYADIVDEYGDPIIKTDLEDSWANHFAFKYPIHHLFAVPSGYCN